MSQSTSYRDTVTEVDFAPIRWTNGQRRATANIGRCNASVTNPNPGVYNVRVSIKDSNGKKHMIGGTAALARYARRNAKRYAARLETQYGF